MIMTKMTIANKFDEVVKALQGEASAMTVEEMVDFINDRKEKSVKKSSTKKTTAHQKENEGVKATILANLTSEGQTVTELMASSADFDGFTNQRLSALLRQLVIDGKVVKTIEGKKSYFSVA